MTTIGQKIKQIAADNSFTLKELADRAGIPYRSMQNYASDKQQPGVEALTKLRELLDIDLNWLLTDGETLSPAKDQTSTESNKLLSKQIESALKVEAMADLTHFIFKELDKELFLTEQLPDRDPFWFIANVYQGVISHLPEGLKANSSEGYDLARFLIKEEIRHYNQVVEIARSNTEKRARKAESQDSGSGSGTTQTFNAQVGQVGGGDINNDFSTKGK